MTTLGEQFNQLVEAAMTVKQTQPDPDKNVVIVDESAKSQDFFQENKDIGKKYTTAHIKSRNFLSNMEYVGISKEDYYNENFNPFSLDRKLADKTKHEMIYMLWKECIPVKFYKHICKEKNLFKQEKSAPAKNC